jgi:molybdopterin converting factor small subunit
LPINVRVRLLGIFRGFFNTNQLSIELEQATIRQLIQTLVEPLPIEARKLVIDPELNDPRPNSLILLNGKEISVLKGLDTEMREDDEVTLIPISHGG